MTFVALSVALGFGLVTAALYERFRGGERARRRNAFGRPRSRRMTFVALSVALGFGLVTAALYERFRGGERMSRRHARGRLRR